MIILVVGILPGFTHTAFVATRPVLAGFGLVVALIACGALAWLGIEWYYSHPSRK